MQLVADGRCVANVRSGVRLQRVAENDLTDHGESDRGGAGPGAPRHFRRRRHLLPNNTGASTASNTTHMISPNVTVAGPRSEHVSC